MGDENALFNISKLFSDISDSLCDIRRDLGVICEGLIALGDMLEDINAKTTSLPGKMPNCT
jgi:hypothetical protein